MITETRIIITPEQRQQATADIVANPGAYLKPDKKGKGFKCPLCGSGSGDKGTGLSELPGNKNHFTCWSCGKIKNKDVIDIIALEHSITPGSVEAFNKAYEIYGINTNAYGAITSDKTTKGIEISKIKESAEKQPSAAKNKQDFTNYYQESQERLKNSREAIEYLKGRGLSLETVTAAGWGYDPKWVLPTGGSRYPSKQIIIPRTTSQYIARAINSKSKLIVGGVALYKPEQLQDERPLFVVEGEINAESITEAGGRAMGIGSTTSSDMFIKLLEAEPPKAEYLIISLDNDEKGTGQEHAQKIANYLHKIGFSFFLVDLTKTADVDINDMLQANRPKLEEAVKALLSGKAAAEQYIKTQGIGVELILEEPPAPTEEEQAKAAEQEQARQAIKSNTAAEHMGNFLQLIKHNKKQKPIKTGFTQLDFMLDGGLYEDTTLFIGAISSLGKTTLALQMADNIAQQGQHVLIFSLEMARTELMAKSISRLTFLNSCRDRIITATTREIMTGNIETTRTKAEIIKLTEQEQAEKRENIAQSIKDYNAYNDKITIHEAVGATTVETIKKTVEQFIKAGIKPVVFIDYMQIVSPSDPRKTDKQTLDETVMLLKQLARKYKLVIIGVSSFNRESYKSPVTMTSFKESGGIEYSSDILIGLQLEGVEDYSKLTDTQKKTSDFDIDELKKKYPRKIELKILKNRNGETGELIKYHLYSKYNYFEERTTAGAYNESEPPPRATIGKGTQKQ